MSKINYEDVLHNYWFTKPIIKWETKYFFNDMQRKLSFAYTEFGLAIKILMAHYKGLSDFFILTNYLAISINVEINKVQQIFKYKEFRRFLKEAVEFKANLLYEWSSKEKFINDMMTIYDLFLETEDGKMKYRLDNMDKLLTKKIVDIYNLQNESAKNIEIIVREHLIHFWWNINKALTTLYDWNDVEVPQSLGFSMQEKWRVESLDYRIQADPVKNFFNLKNWTYRLLASKIIDLDQLWYDEYTPIYKDKLWSQKLHIWCGTTNSWKSTSIVSALAYLYNSKKAKGQEYKIYTIEDPIEKKLDFAYQLQVDYNNPSPDRRVTFSDWVKSAMRNSPKVIVVWEIRDLDTGVEALNSAISWHTVISTIHTNTSFAVFQRLKNLKWWDGEWAGIALNDILSGLWVITTTNLLTTYPIEKTIPIKDLIKPIEKDWKKTYLYVAKLAKKKDKISWKLVSDSPVIDDFFYALLSYKKAKKEWKEWDVSNAEWEYPTLFLLYKTFERFSKFYYNNVFIDFWNKLKVFHDFKKWFEYTIVNQRLVIEKVDSSETGMKPVMEVLVLESQHINLLQTAPGEEEIYQWLCENEKTFLPRFYFAYLKNKKLIEEKQKTFNFIDIVNLANIWYVFRI